MNFTTKDASLYILIFKVKYTIILIFGSLNLNFSVKPFLGFREQSGEKTIKTLHEKGRGGECN